MAKLLIILLLGFMVGCASTSHVTIRELSRDIVLSSTHPEDAFIRAKLIGIASDGTTTILVTPSGPELRAAVGDYFVSSEYGSHGLQLVSASAEKHEARFLRRWAE
jgi:hypothetical protein